MFFKVLVLIINDFKTKGNFYRITSHQFVPRQKITYSIYLIPRTQQLFLQIDKVHLNAEIKLFRLIVCTALNKHFPGDVFNSESSY